MQSGNAYQLYYMNKQLYMLNILFVSKIKLDL